MKCITCKGTGMIGAGTKMNETLPDFMKPITTRVCHVCNGNGEEFKPYIPKAYNDCTCDCHRQPGISHIASCCGPGMSHD